ncbi:conserved hypothetical protein [Neospora caninum Liverpool]|uniref:Uncharacterized protein n=1 Tax=Neospora caninum (strain Liverpool) TaxID=572307 RepID=F0VDY1_NEOCL|nr:conserved hypothetical protein [Neospora caninum Liverpool]CBZ51924.1 conserved hypothetical protein [Neospora caninum Liverpool]CEL65886.1 TPA: hypothetical protein BN1204_017160 [Neospora caninum Liverpool]|eukprot:XP_003881957.1 conserved hypothetical protein [Neospora caninum Liverpool]
MGRPNAFRVSPTEREKSPLHANASSPQAIDTPNDAGDSSHAERDTYDARIPCRNAPRVDLEARDANRRSVRSNRSHHAKKGVEVHTGFEHEHVHVHPPGGIASSLHEEGGGDALTESDWSTQSSRVSGAEERLSTEVVLRGLREATKEPPPRPEPGDYPVRSMRARVQASVRKRKSQERVRRSSQLVHSDDASDDFAAVADERASRSMASWSEWSGTKTGRRKAAKTQQRKALPASPRPRPLCSLREASLELKSTLVDEESQLRAKNAAVDCQQDMAFGRALQASHNPSWCCDRAISPSARSRSSFEFEATTLSWADAASDGAGGSEAGARPPRATVELQSGKQLEEWRSNAQSTDGDGETGPASEGNVDALGKGRTQSANTVLEIDMRETATQAKQ